ncbi:MAG: hypothetical protein NPIRA05_13930 [Nitrospirales bacterium]|nr:MAG: hypothetical protein NPIRA05_13930 [Nitrospirales bacterium]
MNGMSRFLYLLVGALVFVFSGWLTVVSVIALSENATHQVLGIPTSIWIGTLGSISASGIFFTISEGLRWLFDSTVSRNYQRLRFYEETVGIKDFFSQKGSEDANSDYGKAIASAKHRVWAFGISNGEFISEHLDKLISKKKRQPALDVCISFVDPETKIVLLGQGARHSLSQVQLYDLTRDGSRTSDDSSRVSNRVAEAMSHIQEAGVTLDIRLVSPAGYLSAMVVDDTIYMFPFTAVSKDNTRTPYLKVSTGSQIGGAMLDYLEAVRTHHTLSRVPE